jgi:hypothetical protein
MCFFSFYFLAIFYFVRSREYLKNKKIKQFKKTLYLLAKKGNSQDWKQRYKNEYLSSKKSISNAGNENVAYFSL